MGSRKNILYWEEKKKNEQDGKGYYNAGVDKKGLRILRASELFRNTYSSSTAQKANENTDCIRKIRRDIIREFYMKLVSSNLSGHIDKSEAKNRMVN